MQPTEPLASEQTSPTGKTLADLRPIFEFEKIAAKVLEEMGLGSATTSTDLGLNPGSLDFSVLHFVILPQRSVWLDLMLETDRVSAQKIYEIFSGTSEAGDADLEDVLREAMNLIHGSLKVAFKDAGVDVIIPLVPQSIASEKISLIQGGCCLQNRHVLRLPGISLRLTLLARVAPITRKQLKHFRIAEVLIEPIAPGDNQQLVIVKKHTMLNKRLLQKCQNMAEFEIDSETHAIIEPSPLAELLPND